LRGSTYDSLSAQYLEEVVAAQLVEVNIAQAKEQAIIENLPTWSQVDAAITAISSLAEAKAFMKKLARVVYWDVKNSQE
jgi:hypothetical protein